MPMPEHPFPLTSKKVPSGFRTLNLLAEKEAKALITAKPVAHIPRMIFLAESVI
jgi:hypothetical protein